MPAVPWGAPPHSVVPAVVPALLTPLHNNERRGLFDPILDCYSVMCNHAHVYLVFLTQLGSFLFMDLNLRITRLVYQAKPDRSWYRFDN